MEAFPKFKYHLGKGSAFAGTTSADLPHMLFFDVVLGKAPVPFVSLIVIRNIERFNPLAAIL